MVHWLFTCVVDSRPTLRLPPPEHVVPLRSRAAAQGPAPKNPGGGEVALIETLYHRLSLLAVLYHAAENP